MTNAARPTRGGEVELETVCCPLCGWDDAEPAAVGNDFSAEARRGSFLAVCCNGCGLVYLSPRPTAAMHPAPGAGSSRAEQGWRDAETRRVVGLCRPLYPEARVLHLAYAGTKPVDAGVGAPSTWTVDTRSLRERDHQGARTKEDPEEGAYDLVLLLEGLERCDAPASQLQIARVALRRGGRLVILTPNSASTVATLFRGRHWSDYDFPRHVCLFNAASLRRAAEQAGFSVERLDTAGCPPVWVRSAANLLQDWGAPRWLVPSLTPPSAFCMALAWLAEQIALHKGKGAMLRAVLMRPDEGHR